MTFEKEHHRRNRAVRRIRDALYGEGGTPTPTETRLAYIMALEPRTEDTPQNYFGPWPTNRGIDLVMREDLLFRTKVCVNEVQLFDELDYYSSGNQPDVIVLVGPEYEALSLLSTRISDIHPNIPVAVFTFVQKGVGTRYPESPQSIAKRAFYDLRDALVACGALHNR